MQNHKLGSFLIWYYITTALMVTAPSFASDFSSHHICFQDCKYLLTTMSSEFFNSQSQSSHPQIREMQTNLDSLQIPQIVTNFHGIAMSVNSFLHKNLLNTFIYFNLLYNKQIHNLHSRLQKLSNLTGDSFTMQDLLNYFLSQMYMC